MKISPSILSADFARLGEDIDSVRTADYLHFDVMDGIFVRNLSIGLPVLDTVRRHTDMTLDVHLMITQPVRYVDAFCDAGADIITAHIEADSLPNISSALDRIRERGRRAGLAIKPITRGESVLPYLDKLDMIVIMTVEPGFGGLKFMTDMMPKVELLRREIDRRCLACEIEIDGGVNPETAGVCARAGADVLVAGSDIFKAPDRAARIELLRRVSTL